MNDPIVNKYVDPVSRYKMDKEEAYTKMNEELLANGQKPYSQSAFNSDVYNHRHMINTINYQGDKYRPNSEEFTRQLGETSAEMTKRHEELGNTSSFPLSSR